MKRLCLLLAISMAPAAWGAFKCVDEAGKTHIGDTPPPGCDGVVMYETSKSGAVIRKIDPTPTPEQLKARAAEYERVKEQLKAEGVQKRADGALLNTFATEKEFDVAADRNIEPIKGRIKSAEERIKAVDKRVKELEEEMEFYKAGGGKKGKSGEPPPQLSADLQRVRTEKVALISSIARYEKEIEQVRAKFEADKKRWLAIKYPPREEPKKAEPEPDAKAAKKADPAKKADTPKKS